MHCFGFLADEPTMEAKETLAVEQKRSIAQAAAQLINANDFVFIDAGSTTTKVALVGEDGSLLYSFCVHGSADGSKKMGVVRGDDRVTG